MPANFVLRRNDEGEYMFNFLASTGEILLISGAYDDKAAAEAAINDLRVNSLMSQQLTAARTKDGDQFFLIKGSDGDILVKSALYGSQMVMANALHCVKDNVCVAEITDLTN